MSDEDNDKGPPSESRAGEPEWQPPPEAGARPPSSAWDVNAFLESFLTVGVRRGGKGHRADAAMTEYLKENGEHWPDGSFLFRQARFFLALQDGGHTPTYVPGPARGFRCEECGRTATRRRGRNRGDLTPRVPCHQEP